MLFLPLEFANITGSRFQTYHTISGYIGLCRLALF